MNSRDKGHRLERRIAKTWRDMGFMRAKTTRSCSRQLDACGIDIIGTTWLT